LSPHNPVVQWLIFILLMLAPLWLVGC